MRKSKSKHPFTGIACAIVKTPGAGTLFETVEFTIVDGQIISTQKRTRAPDTIDICVAKAAYHLLDNKGQRLEADNAE
jgi:hypothetical protein